jgi:hypothetical protein
MTASSVNTTGAATFLITFGTSEKIVEASA